MASAHGTHASEQGAQDLLGPAWQMRWRVPELALMLSDRAVAQARHVGDRTSRLRAEAVALFACNRLGRGGTATGRAIASVRDAESAGQEAIAAELRVELACCARSVGSHEVAVRVLAPVLEREQVEPSVRGHALLELAAALPVQGREAERTEALDEADRLFAADTVLNRDENKLLRARVSAARANHHRTYAEYAAANDAAEAGLERLERLGDPGAESGEIFARLVLERVHALFELGRHAEVTGAAEPVLSQPVRAASAAPSGWLRLALATRRHLVEGEYQTAFPLLNEAVAAAERHRLDDLLAEALATSSHVHEKCEDFVEALHCLRGAQAAERRWRSTVHAARIRLLEEFPTLAEVNVPAQQKRTPEQPEDREQHARDASDEQARETARRLMETLTTKRAELSKQSKPSYAEPPVRPDLHTSAPDTAGDIETGHCGAGGRPPDPAPSGSASSVRDLGGSAASTEPEPAAPTSPGQSRSDQEALAWPSASWPGDSGFPSGGQEFSSSSRSDNTASPRSWSALTWEATSGVGGADRTPTPSETPPLSGTAHTDDAASTAREHAPPVSGPEPSGPPDVTAIMPVIPAGPDTSERAGWPGIDQQSTPTYDETRLATDSPRFASDPLGERAGAGLAANALSADPASGSQQDPLSAPGDPAWEPTPDPRRWESASEPVGDRESVPEELVSASRRTRGKSLDEIRESLRLLQERAQGTRDKPEPTSGRRARHAEPESGEHTGGEPAAEFIARFREGRPAVEETAHGAERREPGEPFETPTAHGISDDRGTSEPEPEPEAAPTGLADLLAEALLAYEDGRRDTGDAASGSRHADSNVSGITRTRGGQERHRSTSDMPARHRRAATESTSADPWYWTPPAY